MGRHSFLPVLSEHMKGVTLVRNPMNVAAAAAKSLQSCPTLWDPKDGSPPGSSVPGILQARTLEWVAISFSSAWKWKVKVKSLSYVRLFTTPWTAATRLLHPWDFPGKSTGLGCHCLLCYECYQCGRTFSIKNPSDYTKELTQGRNLTNIKTVGKPSCGK